MSEKKSEITENYFEECAAKRIKINDLIERTDELLDKTREIIGVTEDEWDEWMERDETPASERVVDIINSHKYF
jgi:alpha-L-arabinofuranosidase